MTDPKLAPEPGLEDLLAAGVSSAIARDDAALAAAGVPQAAIAGTRAAIAAVGLAGTIAEPPPSTLRDRILATRARGGRYGVFADRVARLFDLPVAEAEALMRKAEDPASWMPFLVQGTDVMPVPVGPKLAGAIATLGRVQPGARFPEHAHRGEETMLVLEGGFNEGGTSNEGWRGDEILRGEGTQHSLVGLPGPACVAAVVIIGYADFL